jgi:hypothetical protein
MHIKAKKAQITHMKIITETLAATDSIMSHNNNSNNDNKSVISPPVQLPFF